ncbi:MAG: hypothetical protein J5J06_18560, partial [Phycisphaerae bacterium]|nr:hypothetical protein [Phycisphaerae bacterium]
SQTGGATQGPGGINGTDINNYFGTLILEVPSGAAGTYTIPLKSDPLTTFLADENSLTLLLTLNPGVIAIACQTNADCDDGNACTNDTCNQESQCVNTPNYDPAQSCCNPADGTLTPLSDNNACTDDVCDAGTGVVSHPPKPAGSTCGNSADTQCDNPDSCDGAGVCLSNFEPSGTACGDPTSTDCNGADTCNGSGVCLNNFATAGTPCGDPSDTDCTNPDTCSGAGVCLSNNASNSTPCDDGLFCNVGEACLNGVCTGGAARNCSDGLPCTSDSCDDVNDVCVNDLDPGNCLIGGMCYSDGQLDPANDCQECDTASTTTDWTFLNPGTACDDGDPCTGTGRPGIGIDTCDGSGVCSGTPDPECNDQCSFAIPLVEGSQNSTISAGGNDDVEATCQPNSNNDIWFVYTATCDGLVFMSTTGSNLAPSNDTVLSVYDECPDQSGVELACDDDSGAGLQAALTLSVVAGEDYFVRIAGFEQNVGPVVITVETVNDCVIDGVCYAAGELNPMNDCEACLPLLSSLDWSPRAEGSACGDPSDSECDGPDACDGAGFCEVNNKPDGIVCADDLNVCTFDVCQAGACAHPPVAEGSPCGDPTQLECDNPDTCDAVGVCQSNFVAMGTPCGDPGDDQCDNPDTCTGDGFCGQNFEPDGTFCNDNDICTNDDQCVSGLCEGTPIPEAPLVDENGPRSVLATPQPPASIAPVALRVTSPDWPCLDKYVQANGTLAAAPVFQLPSAWGTISLVGPDMVPSTTYVIEAECGAFTSPAGMAQTCNWCDINCDGAVNGADILFQVNGFQGDLGLGVSFEAMDVHPCAPDHVINGLDILRCVLAFQFQQTYADTGCPLPCP